MDGWRREGLMKEGRTIQHQLIKQQHRPVQQTAHLFVKFMMEGKVRAILRLISEDNNGALFSWTARLSPGPFLKQLEKS